MTDRKLKTIFIVSGIFPWKADSVILLGSECTANSQNLNKIVRAIFKKNYFFSYVNYPYFGGSSKTEINRHKIFARGLQISNLNKIGQLV